MKDAGHRTTMEIKVMARAHMTLWIVSYEITRGSQETVIAHLDQSCFQ